eukprot:TRINITY_DN2564_c0_g1_i21.p1 TRINITY_DN2564_c0_g1~~TRINITY_DN2564_c0_g1_i21.p1  ORF type:complete len:293 (+),score=43.49 TRINITY_DN2564_c0_g1_i21:117-995(+)
MEKYNEASTLFKMALQSADPECKLIMENQVQRYSDKAAQIKNYLESSSVVQLSEIQGYNFSDPTPLVDYQTIGESILPLPFGVLPTLKTEPVNSAVPYTESYLWKSLGRLTSLLSLPNLSKSAPTDPEIGLDSSFVLLPSNDSSSQTGLRVKIDDDPEVDQIKSEVQKLILANQNLAMYNNSAGLHNLLSENVLLKQSILTFHNQLQKQSTSDKTKNRPVHEEESCQKRIDELEETIQVLNQILSEKQEEIEHLKVYEMKWKKLKEDARRKKKERSISFSESLCDKGLEHSG